MRLRFPAGGGLPGRRVHLYDSHLMGKVIRRVLPSALQSAVFVRHRAQRSQIDKDNNDFRCKEEC